MEGTIHAVRRNQAHQHCGIKRRPSPRFLCTEVIARAQIPLWYHIAQEKHQVALGKLGHRTLDLLTITLRFPGTIGVTTRAHPTLQAHEALIGTSRERIIVARLTQGNHQFIGPADSFSDSLLVQLGGNKYAVCATVTSAITIRFPAPNWRGICGAQH